MVNEISGIGWTSAAQVLGQAGASQPSKAGTKGDASLSGDQSGRPEALHAGFSGLATPKDEAARVAQSVREAGKVLRQAENLFQKVDQKLAQVKSYPPFPAGSEQRQNYINSINGLRRQLEALSVPPVESGLAPVFYPQETELPELDPVNASDDDVAAFAAKVTDAKASLAQGYQALRSVVAAAQAKIDADYQEGSQ